MASFPVYSVTASSVRHIQLSINLARNANLRLAIKNTGHDYLGKSSGAAALSIWTHNLKDMTFYQKLTIPGYSRPALKIGVGVTVREMYEKAHEHGVSALGGICESVGYAGGYIAGGGHTPLSGLYGMAADHVMALEVVTADGRFVTASPKHNPDLFWALRRGGGGTHGVVTSVITRVHPKIPVVTSNFSLSTSANLSAEIFWEGLRAYFELFIPFTDAETYLWWTLVVTPYRKDFVFTMDPFLAPNHTITSFNATFAAIRYHSSSGRLLFDYHQAPRNRANVDNAVSPAFRHAISFLILSAGLPPAEHPTIANVKAATDNLFNNILPAFRAVAPESAPGGSYLNEANVDQPNWQEAFYGEPYKRLLRIKKYDPDQVFYAPTAVSSEGWEVRDGEQGHRHRMGGCVVCEEAVGT